MGCEPVEVEEFVDHFNFLDDISSNIPQLEKDFTTISQLYSVVRHYQIEISEEQNAIYRILFMKLNHLKTALKIFATNKEATLTKFRNSLEASIVSLRVDVSNLKDKVGALHVIKFSISVLCNEIHVNTHCLWDPS